MMITLSHLGLRNYVFFVLSGVMFASAWLFFFYIFPNSVFGTFIGDKSTCYGKD